MKYLIKLILNVIAVVITAYILPGVHLAGYGYAVVLAVLLSLLNVSVKPLLIFLTIPATIFSLGLFLLVINAAIIEIAAWILTPGFNVDSFWWAFLFSILLSVINSLFERLTVKRESRDDSFKVYDKDGNRIA
ncbi:MAG TPA: phage holin family protein [Chitinophagales bacterium]|nr:phage holin family protein [Chitinophagales bacterium]